MVKIKIKVFSHYFVCRANDQEAKQLLTVFTGKQAQLELTPNPDKTAKRKYIYTLKCIYASFNKQRTEYRYHRNQLDTFIEFLKIYGLYDRHIEITYAAVEDGAPVVFDLIDKRSPRDYQVPYIEYLSAKDKKPNEAVNKILILQTGKGKTFVSLQAIFSIGQRVLLTLTRETYIFKWKDDVSKAYGLEDDEVYIIQGRESILELSKMALDGRLDKVKFIISSTRTLSDFIKNYEECDNPADIIEAYGMLPDELWSVAKIGCRFIDEVHEHFHSVFRLDLYTHVPYAINLTATLLSDSPFVERQMVVAFPYGMRPPPTPFDKYIDVWGYFYSLSSGHRNKIRYKQPGRGSYSHVSMEKSILKDRDILFNYLSILEQVMDEKYFGIREGNQKLIVFASTIKMCDTIVKAFKRRMPGEDIRKYTAEDSYNDLMNARIIVATPGSAGTAVDIPDLLAGICTVNIRSKVANVQMLGRLRRLEDYPDTTPQFAYLVCDDIRSHLDYHDHKLKLFSDKARQHGEVRISKQL